MRYGAKSFEQITSHQILQESRHASPETSNGRNDEIRIRDAKYEMTKYGMWNTWKFSLSLVLLGTIAKRFLTNGHVLEILRVPPCNDYPAFRQSCTDRRCSRYSETHCLWPVLHGPLPRSRYSATTPYRELEQILHYARKHARSMSMCVFGNSEEKLRNAIA